MLAASIEGWDYPFSRVEAILADIWDLSHAKAGPKKMIRYPRPFGGKAKEPERIKGSASGMTRAETVARLRALGHNVS